MQKKFQRALFFYEEIDEDLVGKLGEYLDLNGEIGNSFFGVGGEPNIHIISTKKDFDKIFAFEKGCTVEEIPLWLVGWSAPNKDIYYVSLHDYQNTSHFNKRELDLEYYAKGLLHEYIHYLNRLYCEKNHCPFSILYLSEGLAVTLSGQGRSKTFTYSLEDLLHKNNCYDGWYLVTKYIIDNYSQEFVMDLLKDNKRAEQFLIDYYAQIQNYYQKKGENTNGKRL